jgi:hypothetical protein
MGDKQTNKVENAAPEITLEDDFVFGADEDDDDEVGDISTFGNPAHHDEEEPVIGCEDCVFGLCDCGYDFD